MRMEDERNFRGTSSGVYAGNDPLESFRDFLRKAEQNGTVLPSWWSQEKSVACQEQGMRTAGWSQLHRKIQKSDIQEHYGDSFMPMKLRVLAERITGSNVMSPG